jgi:lipid II:glycine glycyltransferase (peptidoglycan interpeptide bridge formation enzyme)
MRKSNQEIVEYLMNVDFTIFDMKRVPDINSAGILVIIGSQEDVMVSGVSEEDFNIIFNQVFE